MKEFFDIVYSVINECSMILEVIDSRMPDTTRNKHIEDYITKRKKVLIIVINKCDLISKQNLEKIKQIISKQHPCIFISAQKHLGTLMLKRKIMQHSKGLKFPIRIGVIGYPNTGKSSLINALKGSHSAKTSPIAGFTKSKQWLKVNDKIMLIDTPGVIPYKKTSETDLVLASARSAEKIKDPEKVAVEILKIVADESPELLKQRYNLNNKEISFDSLEKIAIEKKKLKKHAEPDTELVAKMIIQDWQKGKLRLKVSK